MIPVMTHQLTLEMFLDMMSSGVAQKDLEQKTVFVLLLIGSPTI